MNQLEVRKRLRLAIDKLLTRDRELLTRDVNERSITHKLAAYLQEQFPDLNVDCEYNRDHDKVKKLEYLVQEVRADDTDAKTVFPDIIVHRRGTHEKNFLVIEVKKSTNRQNADVDLAKLGAFKADPKMKYEHAVFLQFRTGDKNPCVERCEFV